MSTKASELSQFASIVTIGANNDISLGSSPISDITAVKVNTNNLEVSTIKAKDGTAVATIANNTGVITFASSVMTTTDINGGTIDGATIGGASASSGVFTTLSASGAASFSGTTTLTAQLGLGGPNYGSSGQVLTSQGAGSAPTWANSFPSGGIIIWSGSQSTIPSGWFLCNGANGTPDLRDRFVVGAGSTYAVGATGGQNSITSVPAHTHGAGNFVTSNTGAHTHTGTTSNSGAHTHTPNTNNRANNSSNASNSQRGSPTSLLGNLGNVIQIVDAGGDHAHNFSTSSTGAHSHNITGNTASAGNASVDIRPLYYALCYIMKG
jgi:hypothetical protein